MRLSKHTCLDRTVCKIQSYFWAQFTRITLKQNKNLVVWSLLCSILTHQPHTSNSITIYTLQIYFMMYLYVPCKRQIRYIHDRWDTTKWPWLFLFLCITLKPRFLICTQKAMFKLGEMSAVFSAVRFNFWEAEKALPDPNELDWWGHLIW